MQQTSSARPLRALTLLPCLVPAALAGGDEVSTPKMPKFEAPVPMTAGGEPIRTEAPGYAAPAWYDVNADGNGDLIVGQFRGGKMAVYPGQKGDGVILGGQEWLQAGGAVAEVPGVW